MDLLVVKIAILAMVTIIILLEVDIARKRRRQREAITEILKELEIHLRDDPYENDTLARKLWETVAQYVIEQTFKTGQAHFGNVNDDGSVTVKNLVTGTEERLDAEGKRPH